MGFYLSYQTTENHPISQESAQLALKFLHSKDLKEFESAMYSFNTELMGIPPRPIDNKGQDIQDTILQQAYKKAVLPYAGLDDEVLEVCTGHGSCF